MVELLFRGLEELGQFLGSPLGGLGGGPTARIFQFPEIQAGVPQPGGFRQQSRQAGPGGVRWSLGEGPGRVWGQTLSKG